MIIYCSGKKKATPRPKVEKDLSKVPGVQKGGAIVWAHGNAAEYLSNAERAALLECCGWKDVHEGKALRVKELMPSKTCAQIIAHFRGRKGWKESTIKNIHRALSRAAGEGV